MSPQRIGGVVILVVGLVLLMVGWNASDSIADQMSSFFTGHYTDRTMWYLIGGAALAAGGLALTVFGGHRLRT